MKLNMPRNLNALCAIIAVSLIPGLTPDIRAGQTRTYQWNDGSKLLKLVIKGDAHFTPDDLDIDSLSSDGSLVIEQKNESGRNHLEVYIGSTGKIEYEYLKDGVEEPWVPKGKAWLAKLLPELIRETAIDAPARVNRIRKSKGEIGVLDEISLIHSDGAKRAYFRELFVTPPTSQDILIRAARQTGQEIRSDGDKSAVLKILAPSCLINTESRSAYFETLQTIRSDGDKKSTLVAVLKTPKLNSQSAGLAINAAKSIHSDGDKASVIIEAISATLQDDELLATCLDATDTIRSSGDQRRVLTALLKIRELREGTLLRAIQSAARISSDGDKAAVLIATASFTTQRDEPMVKCLEATASIHSDGDKARVLTALLKQPKISADWVAKIVAFSQREIRSDGDRRRVEKLAAENSPAARL